MRKGSRLLWPAILLAACAAAQSQSVLDRLESARRLKAQGSSQRALQVYEGVIPGIQGNPVLLAQVLLEASQSARAAGDYPRALDHGSDAARVARQNGDPRGEGLAFNNIGLARLYQSDYPGALAGFQRSLELADQQHDDDAASIRLGNLGNVYFYQGKYLDALRVYEEALRRAEIGGAAVSNGRQLALANLAILYEQLGQNEKALGYYQRAQASASALKPDEYAQLLSNLGTLYRRMGDPVKALDTYERARQVFARGKHPDGEIHVLHNIGIVLALDYKAPARALGAFTLALRLAESTADRRQAVLGRLFRGEALYRLERFEASRAEFDAALAGARQIGAGC